MDQCKQFLILLRSRHGADMSEVAEEPMDKPAAPLEKDLEEQMPQEEQSSPKKSHSSRPAANEIVEGKRAKKMVERLDIQAPKQMEKLRIEDGGGEKLGDIPRTGYHIGKMKPVDLKPLHTLLFDRPGKISTMKKNLRLFSGFPFDMDSEQFNKKRDKLLKNSKFTCSKLRFICKVLDLEQKGSQSDLVEKILTFLTSPKSSGKRVISKKKRRSKKKLSGNDSKAKTKKKGKPKPRSSSSSPKKSKTGSKSKAIVMDSSSDEDEEDEKAGASAEADGSDAEEKPSEKDEEEQLDKSKESGEEEEEEEKDPSDTDDEDDDDDDDDDDEDSPKSKQRGKTAVKKSAPAKRQRPPAKKKMAAPPRKRAKKQDSDQSEADDESNADKKSKKKKAKPAAKTKKADSSSHKENENAEDSTDDGEPLINLVRKKVPSDQQLKQTVQKLLEENSLDELTMKQIYQKVYDTYPNHDLTSRKDFIKQTVKSLIT
ncbi:hypothetical protein LDENG_00151900 [Lucifuga dentata]|nr:hypothetical protein LDENG_00151900 [Lucifuga dentata]